MGCRTLVCREANILLRRNCIYELNGTKKIFGNKHWRERLKHGQKWNVDGNFMLLDGGLSYVHWSEERTVIDLYVQINFYLRYLRLPKCNKIDILMFSSLKVFKIVNQLIICHFSDIFLLLFSFMIKTNTTSICIRYDAINCMSNQALIYVTPTFWYIINFLLFWCIPLLIKPSHTFGFEVSWGKWTFCSQVYHNDYCICKVL